MEALGVNPETDRSPESDRAIKTLPQAFAATNLRLRTNMEKRAALITKARELKRPKVQGLRDRIRELGEEQ